MRRINLETWPRREHFKVFNTFDYPHFNLCANVDMTAFYAYVKRYGISTNVAIVYMISSAANAIPEFRYRIRGAEVIEHEMVHPSTTILGNEDVFSFCSLAYIPDFSKFASGATEKIAQVQKRPRLLEEDQGRDDLLFLTALPWVTFTSIVHPLHWHPVDSVPRFAWGKFFQEGDLLKMPLSVQAHHALLDGLHAGRFYEKVQAYFERPEHILGAA